MKQGPKRNKKINTIWYRLIRYPQATALSIGLVAILACLFCYYLGKLYPNFKLFDKLSSQLGVKHNKKYNFYTSQPGGAYYAIGEAVNGKFSDGDSVKNCPTSGGCENALKLTIEENSFGLIQEEIITHDDQLQKNVRIVTPLLLERMHIFYRKDLLKKFGREVQLSANTDSCVLQCFSDSARNINVGPVGSGTRILASYVMALVEKQIKERLEKKTPKFRQLNESFLSSFNKMLGYKAKTDSSVDILFYMSADPTDRIKNVLDSGKYELMSIDPSFVVLLNKEFNLGLRVADFKEKYAETKNISTIATLTYLIASKTIGDDDVLKLLKKIDISKDSIHHSLIHLTKRCKNADFNYRLPLVEFGFFNAFNDEYEASMKLQSKEVIAFLLSIITLFFPVFRSVSVFKYIWKRWTINKKIDEVVANCGKTIEENIEACSSISGLKEKVIDLYGDGLLSEAHYNPLMKRIAMYEKKFSQKTRTEGKIKMVNADKGLMPVQVSEGG